MTASGFPSISRSNARVLVLGTLPGTTSLRTGEYYSQKRNAFWRIMEELLGMPSATPYTMRTHSLTKHGIALWDVCASADRAGSLDAEIGAGTIVVNDFAAFLSKHRGIRLIAFNGQKAARIYQRGIQWTLPESAQRIRLEVLPSTSAAHAIPFNQKLNRWRSVLGPALE